MYRRILMSMIAFGLAAFLMGGATMAWFTATTESTVTLQSGKVTIGVSDPAAPTAPVTWSANYNNMAPGQTITSTMAVKNAGTLPMKYRVWAEIAPGSDTLLASTLRIVVNEPPTTPLMTERALDDFKIPNAVIRAGAKVLAVGASENLLFQVTLPTTAGNAVARKDVTVIFHFDATQPDNPGWTEN